VWGHRSKNDAPTKLDDINGKIIPFFEKYTLQGSKIFDFEDFCDAK
jgi:hypothetical protein